MSGIELMGTRQELNDTNDWLPPGIMEMGMMSEVMMRFYPKVTLSVDQY